MVRLVCWKGCGTLEADDDDDGDEKNLWIRFSPLLNSNATAIQRRPAHMRCASGVSGMLIFYAIITGVTIILLLLITNLVTLPC